MKTIITVLILALGAASSRAQAQMCPGDANFNGEVTIAEVQRSVNSYLYGCPDQPRFVDNGDGTISDRETGLMWEKKADWDGLAAAVDCDSAETCPDPHDADNRYTWGAEYPWSPDGTAYTIFLAQLNSDGGFAGHTDWRLPSMKELLSILDYDSIFYPVSNEFHTNCLADCAVTSCSCTVPTAHWSSTSVSSPDNAWIVDFDGGFVSNMSKGNSLAVRAVRGGAPTPTRP